VNLASRPAADRIALFALATMLVPGCAVIGWELWYVVARPNSGGHGFILAIYGMYCAGVVAWSLLRTGLGRSPAAILSVSVFFLGLPLVAGAASLGPLSLLGLLLGIGGLVASLGFPNLATTE
jgi:hypothetical protein